MDLSDQMHMAAVERMLSELAEYLGLDTDPVPLRDFVPAAARIRQGYADLQDRVAALEQRNRLQTIVCAACRHPDGRVVLGVRHFDHIMWKQILGLPITADLPRDPAPDDVLGWGGAAQGFVDNAGAFLTREEAWAVCIGHDRPLIDREWSRGSLHSEHLY